MSTIRRRGKYYHYFARKNGKQIRRSLKTESHSHAMLLRAKLDQEIFGSRGSGEIVSCTDSAAIYIESVKQRCSPKYAAETEHRINAICSVCKNLSDITQPILIDHLRDSHSGYDYNNALSAIKGWLNWCVRNGMLSRSPAANIKKIVIHERMRESLSDQQVGSIIKAAKKETLYPLVMIALYTGLRKSELFRLDWGDIDLKKRTITVKVSKSKKPRVMPIARSLLKALRPIKRESGPICGLANHRRVIKRIFRKARVTGGWHHFRHTFITHTLMAGADLETTRVLAGHGSVAITGKYLHTTPAHMAEAVNRLKFKTVQ